MLGGISDPFVCVSVLVSDLFSMWATLTALGSFFATGGCVKHKQQSQTTSNSLFTARSPKTLGERRIAHEQHTFQNKAFEHS